MDFDRHSRPLFAALCLSLALHLIVMFGAGFSRHFPATAENAAPPLQIVVRAGRPPVAPSPSVAEPPVRELRRPPARPVPMVSPQPAPSVPAVASVAAESVVAPPPTGGAPSGIAAVEPATAGGVSADGLRQYRIDLAGAARRFRVYPAVARSRGWEGVVEVTVSIASGGEPSVRLARSSGHAVLDEQALLMLSRAVAQTPLPESLRGRSFAVPLPIRFSLDE
jgi:protein TonB